MDDIAWLSETTFTEALLLVLAFALSAVVGLERERRLKSAGLRTHTLVGVGSAVFTLVSAYGFQAATGPDAVVDPSRIAAQIVSGIGFLGAGVIFVRKDAVAGLTTAASIWSTAAIGMACGAGAPLLAVMATAIHLVTVWGLGRLGARIRPEPSTLVFKVRYRSGHGALRSILALAAESGFEAVVTQTKDITKRGKSPRFQASLALRHSGRRDPAVLLEPFAGVRGVLSVELVE